MSLKKLPDVDSMRGMNITGEIVELQYSNASGEWYALSMTLPNAHYLLSLLSNLPGAETVWERAKEFRQRNPTR
jgi:hypothetical protein